MGRQETLGFVLIFMILLAWVWYTSPTQPTQNVPPIDTVQRQGPDRSKISEPGSERAAAERALESGVLYEARQRGMEETVTISTDKYKATFTSKGGLIKTWELNEFRTWRPKYPVQLVEYDSEGDLSLMFNTAEQKVVDTRNLYWDIQSFRGTDIQLTGTDTYELRMTLPAANGGVITQIYKFTNGQYAVDYTVEFNGMNRVLGTAPDYDLFWKNGLFGTEANSVDDASFAAAYAYAGGELTELDAPNFNETPTSRLSGDVRFVSVRNKYFTMALMPKGVSAGAELKGQRIPLPDQGAHERYSAILKMPYAGENIKRDEFTLYIGPMDRTELVAFDKGLENTMSLGWRFLIRPLAEYIFLPMLVFLNSFIPNWGLVIILFTIIIKIALHPLSKAQMRSIKKMQKLAPIIQEIKEKHKDDQQKANAAVMATYKEYGVNPAGGCLPLLLQMPILFALFQVFRQAVELRQAEFIWWVTDLSVPDVMVQLPFTIPLLGYDFISGLALLMGLTTYIQQKMSPPVDPQQKAIMSLMPIMLTLLFATLPSGLNLYYFLFNLLSIAQQYVVNKRHDDEPLQKVDPKEKPRKGIFSKLPSMKDLEKAVTAQQAAKKKKK